MYELPLNIRVHFALQELDYAFVNLECILSCLDDDNSKALIEGLMKDIESVSEKLQNISL